jgi:histidine triad (HIT) family protein
MDNCIFCKIVNKQIPSFIIYEDESVMAFLDIGQAVKGHTLVVPKTHYQNFVDCDETVNNKVMLVAQKIAKTLLNHCGAKGVNILSNVNEAAGQSIMHYHVHVIPRYDENDGIRIKVSDNSSMYKDKMQDITQMIKNGLVL